MCLKTDSFNKQEPASFSPPPVYNTASPVSSFGSYPSSFGNTTSKAHGSMKLGHKTKTLSKFLGFYKYFLFLNVMFFQILI